MTSFATVRLPDDEAPTLIDRRAPAATEPAGPKHERSVLRTETQRRVPSLYVLVKRWRRPVGLIVAAIFLGGVFGAFLHEVRVSARLRREIGRLERELQTHAIGEKSGRVIRSMSPAASGVPPSQIESETLKELERRAADALSKNDYANALSHYQALSQRVPRETVFVDFVKALQAKLRCSTGQSPRDVSCP